MKRSSWPIRQRHCRASWTRRTAGNQRQVSAALDVHAATWRDLPSTPPNNTISRYDEYAKWATCKYV